MSHVVRVSQALYFVPYGSGTWLFLQFLEMTDTVSFKYATIAFVNILPIHAQSLSSSTQPRTLIEVPLLKQKN
jgi:hypothetical protein